MEEPVCIMLLTMVIQIACNLFFLLPIPPQLPSLGNYQCFHIFYHEQKDETIKEGTEVLSRQLKFQGICKILEHKGWKWGNPIAFSSPPKTSRVCSFAIE